MHLLARSSFYCHKIQLDVSICKYSLKLYSFLISICWIFYLYNYNSKRRKLRLSIKIVRYLNKYTIFFYPIDHFSNDFIEKIQIVCSFVHFTYLCFICIVFFTFYFHLLNLILNLKVLKIEANYSKKGISIFSSFCNSMEKLVV